MRLLGDADMDGVVSILDATHIQRYLVGLIKDDEINLDAADITGNGVDILDATYIQRYIAGFTSEYPIGEPIQ